MVLSSRRRAGMASVVLLSTAVVVDILTESRFRLGPFYLVPVLVVSWFLGRATGLFVAVVAVLLWRGVEVLVGQAPTSVLVRVLDTALHVFSFCLLSLAVAWGRNLFEREKQVSAELRITLENVRELEGLLPLCAWCRRLRNDHGYWQELESYVEQNTRAVVTHGICPECNERYFGDASLVTGSEAGEDRPESGSSS